MILKSRRVAIIIPLENYDTANGAKFHLVSTLLKTRTMFFTFVTFIPNIALILSTIFVNCLNSLKASLFFNLVVITLTRSSETSWAKLFHPNLSVPYLFPLSLDIFSHPTFIHQLLRFLMTLISTLIFILLHITFILHYTYIRLELT